MDMTWDMMSWYGPVTRNTTNVSMIGRGLGHWHSIGVSKNKSCLIARRRSPLTCILYIIKTKSSGQRGRCSNIKREPQIYGSFPNPKPHHFSSGCGFMMGLGKPKLCTKFEVLSFSRCVDIEVEPQNFGELR